MNKSIKKKWLKNLKSGKFKQAYSELKSGKNSFCCLGVLCETMKVGYKPSSNFPCAATLKAAGLKKEQAELLANLNDSGRSFNYIANFIEKEY